MELATSFNTEVINMSLICLIPFLVAFSFFVFVFYRKRRELLFKQKEMEQKQQMADVEMKALRAQMNPHFIFNCMNSIYAYMNKNDIQNAGIYLTKFSNLIRMVLENSLHTEVPLQADIETLELYIQMEQIRMIHGFNYRIETDETLDKENTLVPPLIVQPFVENSIWHGLNGKPDKGTIVIKISRQGSMVKYLVEDDGVEAVDTSKEISPQIIKKKSLGMSLTRERLDVLNKMKSPLVPKRGTAYTPAHFNISDIRDENNKYQGKRVELFLPYEENS